MRARWISLLLVMGCGGTELPLPTDGAPVTPSADASSMGMATSDGASSIEAAGAPSPDAGANVKADPDAGKGNGDDASKGSSGAVDAAKGGGFDGAGTPVTNPATPGVGGCAGKTLADVIAAVHKTVPALADITVIQGMDPNLGGDGNRIFAFVYDKGFRLVFKRGDGDCRAGCIDNRYWYFATDDRCEPVQLGYYERTYQSPGNCYQVSGKPQWGLPPPLDPVYQCGADNKPQNISGDYRFRAAGTRTACTARLGNEPTEKVAFEVQVTVQQTPGDLAKGTVVVKGTGNPLLDGVVLPATFQRRRLAVDEKTSNLPAMCLQQTETSLAIDLETDQPGKLSFFEVRALDCPPNQNYCKGHLNVELTPAK